MVVLYIEPTYLFPEPKKEKVMAHKARNKKTGEITEIWFAMCDHGRKYCFADDYPQDDYRVPMAVTDNYEIID